MTITRRGFLFGSGAALGFAGAAGALGGLGELLEGTAHAYTFTDYRALVCVFLGGGNDGNNLVIPYTPAGYAAYAAVRPDADHVGIAQSELTAADTMLNVLGDAAGVYQYAFHPSMPKLARLFNGADSANPALQSSRKVAIVSNIGPLVKPLASKSAYDAALASDKPENLFSHSDQVRAWESGIADPYAPQHPFGLPATGWGGRLADKLVSANPSAGGVPLHPDVTSVSGRRRFAVGMDRKPIVIASTGAMGRDTTGVAAIDAARDAATTGILGLDTQNALADAYGAGFEDALIDTAYRAAALAGNPLPKAIADLFPNTGIGRQMEQICREILAGAATGGNGLAMKRQSFVAVLGGFDTHVDQLERQATLLAQLDDALDAFYQAIAALNVAGAFPNLPGPVQATMFTMSDFGRTFEPNGNRGTDHAWGNHMLVIGDRVKGGHVYGQFPSLVLGSARDVGEGRWIPVNPVERYAWAFAKWMGAADAEQSYLLPNSANSASFATPIGFMMA